MDDKTKSDITSILTGLNERMLSEQEKARKACQETMKNAFLHVFAAFPEISAIAWMQYTPYFNDGEPCEFTVGDFCVSANAISQKDAEGLDYPSTDNGFYSAYDTNYAVKSKKLSTELGTKLADAAEFLDGVFKNVDQEFFMKGTFGDHAFVVARPDGTFQVMECDHE